MKRSSTVIYFALNTIILLIGIILYLIGESNLSGEFIGTGIIAYIIFWSEFISSKHSIADARVLTALKQYGVCDISDRRYLEHEYASEREKTREHFDIMGFGLQHFIEDNAEKLQDWSKQFSIRILVIDPTSQACDQRDIEEGDSPGKIAADVIRATRLVRMLDNPRIQIKWYSAIPVTNILRMDKTMWVGPYFIGRRSRNSFVLRLSAEGTLLGEYLAHFERVWAEFSRIPEEGVDYAVDDV